MQLKPAKITQIEPQRIRFVLHEGRNRQIRKMFESVQIEVMRLVRVQLGAITLGDLAKGEWRELSEKEIKELNR